MSDTLCYRGVRQIVLLLPGRSCSAREKTILCSADEDTFDLHGVYGGGGPISRGRSYGEFLSYSFREL